MVSEPGTRAPSSRPQTDGPPPSPEGLGRPLYGLKREKGGTGQARPPVKPGLKVGRGSFPAAFFWPGTRPGGGKKTQKGGIRKTPPLKTVGLAVTNPYKLQAGGGESLK